MAINVQKMNIMPQIVFDILPQIVFDILPQIVFDILKFTKFCNLIGREHFGL